MAAPKRSVDAGALVNWLTLRAVEQQAKHLEAMEVDRRGREVVPAAAPPPDVTPVPPVPESSPAASGLPVPGATGAIGPPAITPAQTPIRGGAIKPVIKNKEATRPRASPQPATTVQPPNSDNQSFFDRLFRSQN
jgi:hypothetical protein